MAGTRIRTIKPEFFGSPDTAKASPMARLLFIAMWCWADDYGIGETNLYGLSGFAFQHDNVSPSELQSLLSEIRGTFGVAFYEVRGRRFYAIPSWDVHQKTQRRSGRKFPAPDDPDAVPDQRFYGGPEVSSATQGDSERTQGKGGFGTGEQGNRGTDLSRPPVNETTSLAIIENPHAGMAVAQRLNSTAHSGKAHMIAMAYAKTYSTPVPGKVLSAIAIAIDESLEAGIDPGQIAQGLRDWTASKITATSQIGGFIHKAGVSARSPTVGKPTRKALTFGDAAEALLAEFGTSE